MVWNVFWNVYADVYPLFSQSEIINSDLIKIDYSQDFTKTHLPYYLFLRVLYNESNLTSHQWLTLYPKKESEVVRLPIISELATNGYRLELSNRVKWKKSNTTEQELAQVTLSYWSM